MPAAGCLSRPDGQLIRSMHRAGLRGAGHDVSDEEVKAMRTENGIVGIVDIVARLLAATFGMPGGAAEESMPRSEVRSLDPFRGTT